MPALGDKLRCLRNRNSSKERNQDGLVQRKAVLIYYVFVEYGDETGQLRLRRKLFACAGSSNLNVNYYKLRGESPLMSQIPLGFNGFDLYLANLRVYPTLVDQRHGDWTAQMLNVISICAKARISNDVFCNPKWPRLSWESTAAALKAPWRRSLSQSMVAKTAVLIPEERFNYFRVLPNHLGARHRCHGVHPAAFSTCI